MTRTAITPRFAIRILFRGRPPQTVLHDDSKVHEGPEEGFVQTKFVVFEGLRDFVTSRRLSIRLVYRSAGGRRWCVACSYAYARRRSVASLHGRPKNWRPAGRVSPRVNPIGTVIAGNPVLGENNWLLSPPGVLRSPMSRGGLLHVG